MEFIARFKYGRKPVKTWINFLVKNFTVEEYVGLIRNHEHSNGLTTFKRLDSIGCDANKRI